MLNNVQKAAYDLIQSDAKFIYTLIEIQENAKNINSNYIMMCLPYIGIFVDGAEQWCKKVGMKNSPIFNQKEKKYYVALRQSHKLYELSYDKYTELLLKKFQESDQYFYNVRSLLEKIKGYYNVGTDYCDKEVCGNTILCGIYMPLKTIGIKSSGEEIKNLSIFAGKLVGFFLYPNLKAYYYNKKIIVKYKDYHFYKNCPIKLKNNLGFVLFSMLCSINYAIEFIDKYFVEKIPQKFKFAYLQYYYICDFLEELNIKNRTNFYINKSLKNRYLRNCLTHYGLGQFMNENEIKNNDVLKGLTKKSFNMDYYTCKNLLYYYLKDLRRQIKDEIF